MSWSIFFAVWTVTIIAGFVWDRGTAGAMIGAALLALITRLVGYEQGYRRITVMACIGAVFMALLKIFSR
jgi:hypothetical protein